MEGYGPVGEARTKTWLAPVDSRAAFPGGVQGSGFRGVQAYIKEKRQQDFLENISRKLLSYALSRSLHVSDDPADNRDACERKQAAMVIGSPWWNHRDQPAVPQQTPTRIHSNPKERG